MNISVFRDTFSKEVANIDADAMARLIISDKWKERIIDLRKLSKDEYNKEKVKLAGICWSGTFSERLASKLVEYSQLVCLDVDNLQPVIINELKALLTEDPYVKYAFISPSGAGLKIVVQVNTGPEDHKSAFLHLQKYFQEKFDLEVDSSGKDTCRLCFVSYDPFAIIKPSEVFEVDLKIGMVAKEYVPNPKFANSSVAADVSKIFDVAVKWVEKHYHYNEGQRNTFLHALACAMNRCGVALDQTTYLLNNTFDLEESEINHICKSAYVRHQLEHGTVTVTSFDNDKHYRAPAYVADYSDDMVLNDVMQITAMLYQHSVPKKEMLDIIGKVAKYYKNAGILDMQKNTLIGLMNTSIAKYEENKILISKKLSLNYMLAETLAKDLLGHKNNERAVPTGFPEIDLALRGGLQPGQVYGVIGTDATFKSVLAQFICTNAAINEKATLYLSGEMSTGQFYERQCLMSLGINLYEYLKSDTLNKGNVDEFIKKMQYELNGNLFFVQGTGYNRESILATLDAIKHDTGKEIGLVVMDGLTQMDWLKEKSEIGSTIQNAEECKKIAIEAFEGRGVAVMPLIHVSGANDKLYRATGLKCRGGVKTLASLDVHFGTSLFEDVQDDPNSNDIKYIENKFYLRMTDKRSGAGIVNKIINVDKALRLSVELGDVQTYESKRQPNYG